MECYCRQIQSDSMQTKRNYIRDISIAANKLLDVCFILMEYIDEKHNPNITYEISSETRNTLIQVCELTENCQAAIDDIIKNYYLKTIADNKEPKIFPNGETREEREQRLEEIRNQ